MWPGKVVGYVYYTHDGYPLLEGLVIAVSKTATPYLFPYGMNIDDSYLKIPIHVYIPKRG